MTVLGGRARVGIPTGDIGSIIYGDGSDGAAVFDGVNTFAFASKASSVYTLTRDVFLASGSIEAGCTLVTAGFRLFCKGQFRVKATGLLHNNGKDASGVTAGTGTGVGTLGIGLAGGAGRTGSGTGTAGSNQSNALQDASAAGGAGGAGGAQGGGNGGTYSAAVTNGGANFLTPMLMGQMLGQTSGGNQAAATIIGGGAGGGGGGSDNAGVNGGGGGGGGGVLHLVVFDLVNDGTISANGGKGADAAGAGGNGGGGGGGGGGIILNISRTRSGAGTMTVTGGGHGSKIGASGVVGSDGSPGHINQQTA